MLSRPVQLAAAEKAIKNGWIAACVSMGMTAIIMMISLSSTGVDLGPAIDGGLVLLIDVALMAVLAFFMYRKSRTAATIMFVYFLASKALQFMAGDFRGIAMGVIFLFFYGRAVWGTFTWHRLQGTQNDVTVFSDPVPYAPKDGRLFK